MVRIYFAECAKNLLSALAVWMISLLFFASQSAFAELKFTESLRNGEDVFTA